MFGIKGKKACDRVVDAGMVITATGSQGEIIFHASLGFLFDLDVELYVQTLQAQHSMATVDGYDCVLRHQFSKGERTVSVSTVAETGWFIPAYRLINPVTNAVSALVILPRVQVT